MSLEWSYSQAFQLRLTSYLKGFLFGRHELCKIFNHGLHCKIENVWGINLFTVRYLNIEYESCKTLILVLVGFCQKGAVFTDESGRLGSTLYQVFFTTVQCSSYLLLLARTTCSVIAVGVNGWSIHFIICRPLLIVRHYSPVTVFYK